MGLVRWKRARNLSQHCRVPRIVWWYPLGTVWECGRCGQQWYLRIHYAPLGIPGSPSFKGWEPEHRRNCTKE